MSDPLAFTASSVDDDARAEPLTIIVAIAARMASQFVRSDRPRMRAVLELADRPAPPSQQEAPAVKPEDCARQGSGAGASLLTQAQRPWAFSGGPAVLT